MSFRDQFLATPVGPARDKLIFNAIIAQGPPKNLVPITVPGPNNIKITYWTLPDYVSVEGIRLPLSPRMAQEVANTFHMFLPTSLQSKRIYNAADVKVRATPLSASGYHGSDGQYYSGSDVASHRIGSSDAAIAYNDKTNQSIAGAGENKLIAGHGKDLLEPINDPNYVSMGGWQGKDKRALQPYTPAHRGESDFHSEYGLWTRLISGNVQVTLPNGKVINTTMEKLRANPNLSQAISDGGPIKQYKTTAQPSSPSIPSVPSPSSAPQPQSGRLSLLQRIDEVLNMFS